MDGARWVRKEVLERHPAFDVSVTAVWLPVLKEDDAPSAEADFAVLDEPRVRQFWDPEARTGRWFHEHVVARDPRLAAKPVFRHGITWDAFFVYGREARWGEAPDAAVASGGPVVAESGILRDAVERWAAAK